MNEEEIKKYKKYYKLILLAIILWISKLFIRGTFMSVIEIIAIIMLIASTYTLSKMVDFDNKKAITVFVIFWGMAVAMATFSYMYYWYSSGYDSFLINITCLIIEIVMMIIVSVRCYKNIQTLNNLSN